MPENKRDAKFLQIYFMGCEEEELKKRKEIVPDTDLEILRELQSMLHRHNHCINIFKTAMENAAYWSTRTCVQCTECKRGSNYHKCK